MEKKISVLFLTYPRTGLFRGGLEIQIEKTAAALTNAGVEVIFYDPWKNQIPDVDVCHVFSIDGALVYHVERAVGMGVPVVISPVFNNFANSFWLTRLKVKLSDYVPGMYSDLKRAKKMAHLASAVAALNNDELRLLESVFSLPKGKTLVVPNGIDLGFSAADPTLFENTFGVKDYVLQVGTIEHRKNQLNLIKAVKQLGVKLVIVGEATPTNRDYLSLCETEADANIIFAGRFSHDDPLLRSAYAAAKDFALPSYSEVMPLTLYEAAVAGCRIVVGANVPVAEAIRPYVASANPDDPTEIARVIEQKMRAEEGPELRQAVLDMPSWQDVGDQIKSVYDWLLQGKKGH